MWSIQTPSSGLTNKYTIPTEGVVSIVKPKGVKVEAYVNDVKAQDFQIPVKVGDEVHFELKNKLGMPINVALEYAGNTDLIEVASTDAMDSDTEEYDMTPNDAINLFANPNQGGNMGGALGGGLGAGLVGGLLGTALFGRRGLGGLDGGDGVAGGVTATGLADMSLMQAIGAVDKAVAVSSAAMEASQANQTIAFTNQLNAATGSLATRIDSTKEAVNANAMVLAQQLNQVNTNIMMTANETQKTVYNDGDKTRALITSQYELNLQRQLADANAAIIELRGDSRLNERSRGIEVTTTNNINQMQQQQQQQQQFGQLANLIYALGQNITNGNAAINVGSGTQTANPANTNTNIR